MRLSDFGAKVYACSAGERIWLGSQRIQRIAIRLHERDVLDEGESKVLQALAGYRNRPVHFYHEVSVEELFGICSNQLGDIELIQTAYRCWINEHPEKVDSNL